jgi:hypothetical protein
LAFFFLYDTRLINVYPYLLLMIIQSDRKIQTLFTFTCPA